MLAWLPKANADSANINTYNKAPLCFPRHFYIQYVFLTDHILLESMLQCISTTPFFHKAHDFFNLTTASVFCPVPTRDIHDLPRIWNQVSQLQIQSFTPIPHCLSTGLWSEWALTFLSFWFCHGLLTLAKIPQMRWILFQSLCWYYQQNAAFIFIFEAPLMSRDMWRWNRGENIHRLRGDWLNMHLWCPAFRVRLTSERIKSKTSKNDFLFELCLEIAMCVQRSKSINLHQQQDRIIPCLRVCVLSSCTK